MDSRDLLIGFSAFVLTASLTLLTGLEFFEPDQRELYSSNLDYELNESNDVEVIEFDNRSIEVIFDPWDGRVFFDLNQTGEVEVFKELEEGGVQSGTQVVTFGKDSYRLYFEYSLDPSERYLILNRVEQV